MPLNFLIFVSNKSVIRYNIRLKFIGKLEEKEVKVFVDLKADEIMVNLNLVN